MPDLIAVAARSVGRGLAAPAFEQECAVALEDSRRTFSLAGLYEVVQVWQARLASAPAVDTFVASGYDDTSFVDMAELRRRRR